MRGWGLSVRLSYICSLLFLSRFEDGTLPFLDIVALKHGFSALQRLARSMEHVSSHTFSLARSAWGTTWLNTLCSATVSYPVVSLSFCNLWWSHDHHHLTNDSTVTRQWSCYHIPCYHIWVVTWLSYVTMLPYMIVTWLSSSLPYMDGHMTVTSHDSAFY